MSDVLKTGSDWLMGILTDKVSQTVAIRRGISETTGVSATVGSSDHQQDGDFGGFIQAESRDYLIDVSAYTIHGIATEPKRGDLIVETLGNETHEFEVMPFVGNSPWRFSDDHHTKYRIHTQKVKVG